LNGNKQDITFYRTKKKAAVTTGKSEKSVTDSINSIGPQLNAIPLNPFNWIKTIKS